MEMDDTMLTCDDDQRRHLVRDSEALNGIDYLEVSEDQRTLTVYFLNKLSQELTSLKPAQVRIRRGRRIRDIQVTDLAVYRRPEEPARDDYMVVNVNKPGDFSTYELCIVDVDDEGIDHHPAFDPRYACLEFSFKVGCPSELDCATEPVCPPEARSEPEIDYLAKDYASFRQLMLDRLSLLLPDWQERHVPDIGIALVELLAYVGDRLSYYQDAVATETYLDTARQRISVRRHARLVDYPMHEGCNARAWLHIETSQDQELPPDGIAFITKLSSEFPVEGPMLTPEDLREVPASAYEVFEPLLEQPQEPIQVREAHNEIRFYTWGDQECCLLRGATEATLIDGAPADDGQPQRELALQPGDVLLFAEVTGPETGNPSDANPQHRHIVRLTEVEPDVDPLTGQPILHIAWAAEDALPFPLCISTIGPAPACKLLEPVSVARGNMLLIDHGRTIRREELGTVPVDTTAVECGTPCEPPVVQVVPQSFRPTLQEMPLVFRAPLTPEEPASSRLVQDPHAALPQVDLWSIPPLPDDPAPLFEPDDLEDPAALIRSLQEPATPAVRDLRRRLSSEARDALANDADALRSIIVNELEEMLNSWSPQRDLLASSETARNFVAEVDGRGRAHLRFGNDELGRQPRAGAAFMATYRVGGGPAGNVGAETITHIVLRDLSLSGITLTPRNPLPARGGTTPEPLADVKKFAPHAFRNTLRRAITAEDYAQIVMRDFASRVQRAAATLRWTGSWYEVLVAVDPRGTTEPAPELLQEIEAHLRDYRRIGHDLTVERARHVPLDIELTICVLPDYLRGHVKAELLKVFSNRRLPDGRLGFFHPDNLTFGEGVFLSDLVAKAQAVQGVENVIVETLERLHEGPNQEIEQGVLPLGPLEVAQLDNNPNFPEHGALTLNMVGGR
jgi:hypothetical protein